MDQNFGEPGREPTPEEQAEAVRLLNKNTTVSGSASQDPNNEPTFHYTLPDGCRLTVGLPQGVIRLKLRMLLGDYYADPELKTMGTAFLSIRKWSTYPSPLNNPNQFEAMMTRFGSEEALDDFMGKWQVLTQPELSRIVADTMLEAEDKGLTPEQSRLLLNERLEPVRKKQLEKVRDSLTT